MKHNVGLEWNFTIRVGSIELTDRLQGILMRFICDECGALRAASTVVSNVELDDWSNSREEILLRSAAIPYK